MYTLFLCQLLLLDNEVVHLNEIITTFPATSEAHTPCVCSVTKCIYTWPVCAVSQNVYLHDQYVQCHKMYIYMASMCSDTKCIFTWPACASSEVLDFNCLFAK